MNNDAILIVRGFLQLPNLEKKRVVDTINHFFDELNERETIRADIETRFTEIGIIENGIECKCCGRK